MRAFTAFSIALFFVLTLAVLAIAQRAAISNAFAASNDVLVLEKKYYADVSLKKAFSQVFSLSPGFDERESSENIAANLAELEAFSKTHFREQGIEAALWFGSLDALEEKRVLRDTLFCKHPVRCSHCYSFVTTTRDWEGKRVFKAVEFVFNRKISKNGFVHTPTSVEWVGEEITFGGTFFDSKNSLAWVSVMREGFG